MDEETLKQLVMAATFEEDGRRKLTCSEAFRLATEQGAATLDIARICNKNNIRLCKCQLGCFK
jgi:hypothetical protein